MLKVIKCKNISPLKHGFFTRHGGVSLNVFKGLNCGKNSGDQTKAINKNLSLVKKYMSLSKGNLCCLKQIHSNNVIEITKSVPDQTIEADAMVSRASNIGLGILTADCVPLILNDTNNKIIGAAHVGWRGASNNIVENTVSKMITLGADIANIKTAIGPSISQKHYEVGLEFKNIFVNKNLKYQIFFTPGHADRFFFNLSAFISNSLKEIGILHIDIVEECTYENSSDFYSHRRVCQQGKNLFGRMITVIKQ